MTASLTGLRNLILNRHYEVVLPEIKEDEKDCSGVAEKGDLDDDDVEQDEEKGTLSFNDFFLFYIAVLAGVSFVNVVFKTLHLKLSNYF